jgi:ATP-dependent DNA ligase
MGLDQLYKQTKNNKVKMWSIVVLSGPPVIIRISTGFTDGKMTIFDVTINSGKNIGKANETTSYLQALKDAESRWNKKIDDGYTKSKTGIKKSLIRPMLAQDFTKSSSKMTFPLYIQKKFDGIRAIYEKKNFHSRNLKIFPHLEHLQLELQNIDLILDGELYSHDLPFQVISGIIRKEKLSKKDLDLLKMIQFRVYDVVSQDDYQTRLQKLQKIFQTHDFKNIIFVETVLIVNPKEVSQAHNVFVSSGYEGVILRNVHGKYTCGTRSYDLQKYKVFDDSEFEITGFKDGIGKESGAIIWEFKTKSGKVFDARPSGSIAERKKVFKKADTFIGQFVTVKFFGYTDDGIPRMPVAQLYPRNYE